MLAEILSSRESDIYHTHYSNALGKCGVVIIARCLTGKEISDCSGRISAADMQEAAALFGLRDKERFLTSRMLLPATLSRVTRNQVEATFWRFSRGGSGKPRISEGSKVLNFNVAHARNVVAVAINVPGPIGVDIESLVTLGEEAPSKDLIRLTLSAAERDWINAQSPSLRASAYIKLWTAKEAILKQAGIGPSDDLASLDTLNGVLPHKAKLNSALQVETLTLCTKREACQTSVAVFCGSDKGTIIWLKAFLLEASGGKQWLFRPLWRSRGKKLPPGPTTVHRSMVGAPQPYSKPGGPNTS